MNESFPCLRRRITRPATAARCPLSSPAWRSSNFAWRPAASASLSKRSAKGSIPLSRKRFRLSLRARRTSASRPLPSPSSSLILRRALLEDEPEPFQGQRGVVMVDAVARRNDHPRKAARCHHRRVAAQLLLHPFDHPVDLGGRA